MAGKKPRILLAKPGLDGHDKGIRLVAMALRDAGMEVIYLGLRQTIEDIVTAAVEEDVDVIGLSILSGAQLSISQKLLQQMQENGIADKPLLVGGTIPVQDIAQLKTMGVVEVFPVGSTFASIIKWIQDHVNDGTNGSKLDQ